MPPIASDKDLPKLLETPTKQVKWVKKLALKHLGSVFKHIDRPPMQGMFSRTFMLVLADGREVVQQFRTEPLDLDAFKIAKKDFDPVVPDSIALEDEDLVSEGVKAYSFTRLYGKMWLHGIAGKGAKGRIAINKSLGRALSKGCLDNSSDEAVKIRVRSHLETLLASPLEDVNPYRHQLQGFHDKLEQLKQLPLWVAHYDLNEVNVLIDEECSITGLIDWELSTPLPFGVSFGRIHTYAGEYTGGELWVPDEFVDAERAFWNELFKGMPAETRDKLEKQLDLVQDAVILETLLYCLSFEQGKVVIGSVSKTALPKPLTYRIPFVRGDEPP
ncbi:hypothetical protein N7520_011665 [Penicillium odoratum]|uniref:uncharacterized protein n=1 Tax=Penicillium odoratum TaxID=1167516 RepID=UPI00254770AD|nr:uncharacterized protein N7520_011665 [Penicillium odoratum]KAJ5746483.1 hypothetical protein N7520_011665 [Penicillium odoratum]